MIRTRAVVLVPMAEAQRSGWPALSAWDGAPADGVRVVPLVDEPPLALGVLLVLIGPIGWILLWAWDGSHRRSGGGIALPISDAAAGALAREDRRVRWALWISVLATGAALAVAWAGPNPRGPLLAVVLVVLVGGLVQVGLRWRRARHDVRCRPGPRPGTLVLVGVAPEYAQAVRGQVPTTVVGR